MFSCWFVEQNAAVVDLFFNLFSLRGFALETTLTDGRNLIDIFLAKIDHRSGGRMILCSIGRNKTISLFNHDNGDSFLIEFGAKAWHLNGFKNKHEVARGRLFKTEAPLLYDIALSFTQFLKYNYPSVGKGQNIIWRKETHFCFAVMQV